MNIAKPTNIALGGHHVDVLWVEILVHAAADLLTCRKCGPLIGQGTDSTVHVAGLTWVKTARSESR